MNRPSSGRGLKIKSVGRKASGRLRAHAVVSDPRPSRKAKKFKCRSCGQRIWVDAALRRTAITCPSCKQQVPAPQPGRLWLEICGGLILFLGGFAIGHAPAERSVLPPATSASIIQGNAKQGPVTKKEAPPKPRWLGSQSDGD